MEANAYAMQVGIGARHGNSARTDIHSVYPRAQARKDHRRRTDVAAEFKHPLVADIKAICSQHAGKPPPFVVGITADPGVAGIKAEASGSRVEAFQRRAAVC